MATAESLKTIFSVSPIAAPKIGVFAARKFAFRLRREDSTYSDFRKVFARAWREGPGFLLFSQAGRARQITARGAAMAAGGPPLTEVGKHSLPLAIKKFATF